MTHQTHQRFYRATDKLMNGFIMGTIKHEVCAKCAVGTMCDGERNWTVPLFIKRHNNSSPAIDYYSVKGEKQIIKTGYLLPEIDKIERAFESVPRSDDPDCFIGLSRVFDLLVSMEDWTEEESKINLVELCKTESA